MRKFLVFLGLLSSLGVIYGLLGMVHRSADTIGMLGPVFGFLMVVGAYATRQPWIRVWVGLAGVMVMGSVLLFLQAQEPGGDLRLYSKNLRFSNADMDAISADIQAADVDLVMLQEISPTNRAILDQLKASFPHQHICPFGPRYDIAVLSRHPFAGAGQCSSARAMAAAPLSIDGRSLWAVSVHMPWPWPDETEENEAAAESLIASLDGPMILAGDFNIMPWSGRLRRLRALSQTRLAGPMRITFSSGVLRGPIDHVLGPKGGAVVRRPLFGSDHYGLVASLGL